MLGLLLYVGAVLVVLYLFDCYDSSLSDNKRKEKEKQKQSKKKPDLVKKKLSHWIYSLGIDNREIIRKNSHFERIWSDFDSFVQVSLACEKAGLIKCSVVLGIDFTASNEWQGRRSFDRMSLHKISPLPNPYQQVLMLTAKFIQPLIDDKINAFGFGGNYLGNQPVFSFKLEGSQCEDFIDVLDCYNSIAKNVKMMGHTSFLPIIKETLNIVKDTKKYHILLLITDGQIEDEKETSEAIVEASNFPLSIIVVGVGDGPWDTMQDFDDLLPQRKFDNFQFVDFPQIMKHHKGADIEFAKEVMMELPCQYTYIKKLGYLDDYNNN